MADIFTLMDDDDRVYLLDASRVMRVQNEDEKTTIRTLPTNDPDRYKVVITIPAPRFYIKTAEVK